VQRRTVAGFREAVVQQMRRGCEVLVEVDDVHAGGARKWRQDTTGVRCIGREKCDGRR
jgi:hypothetical protein